MWDDLKRKKIKWELCIGINLDRCGWTAISPGTGMIQSWRFADLLPLKRYNLVTDTHVNTHTCKYTPLEQNGVTAPMWVQSTRGRTYFDVEGSEVSFPGWSLCFILFLNSIFSFPAWRIQMRLLTWRLRGPGCLVLTETARKKLFS